MDNKRSKIKRHGREGSSTHTHTQKTISDPIKIDWQGVWPLFPSVLVGGACTRFHLFSILFRRRTLNLNLQCAKAEIANHAADICIILNNLKLEFKGIAFNSLNILPCGFVEKIIYVVD